MKQRYKMLQIGGENYASHFKDRDEVSWTSMPLDSLSDLEELKKLVEEEEQFDFVFVQVPYSEMLMQAFRLVSQPYNTYVDQRFWNSFFEAEEVVRTRFIRCFSYDSEEDCIKRLMALAFSKQYGDRIHPIHCKVNPLFKGETYYEGRHQLVLKGNFGETYTPILSWNMYLYYDRYKVNEIWLEYTSSPHVEVSYTLRLYENLNMDNLIREFVLEGERLIEPFAIPSMDKDAYIFVTAKAKGEGTLKVGNIHKRWSRMEHGQFILGGQRWSSEDRGEFIHFFHPGDLKPPLNVYFSGYRTAEGFEGYYMMEKFKAPFLLISDLRLEGGGFYLGNDAFENQIKKVIQDTLEWLGFKEDEMIMSGLSMGSFGALYYGAQLNPAAIVVGKPLVNIGGIAENMRLMRPEDFGTALDILLTNERGLDGDAIERLNQKFWTTLNQNQIDQTLFAISYMEHDDYDLYAFQNLLSVLSRQGARVMSRSAPGRHNDNTPTITSWFSHFYFMIMESQFGRVRDER